MIDKTAGISKFAAMMQNRMTQVVGSHPSVLDFGEILADKGLKTTMFGLILPFGDYLVCRTLMPPNGLKVGDRVLVAWVGNDAVVVDRIV